MDIEFIDKGNKEVKEGGRKTIKVVSLEMNGKHFHISVSLLTSWLPISQ